MKLQLSLAGKNCLITGASRGIGLAIAQRFAAEGASCTLVARNRRTLEQALETLPVHTDHPHAVRSFNVAGEAAWKDWQRELKKSKEKIDILVNAAGMAQNSLLVKMKTGDMRNLIDSNLVGTMLSCQHAIPLMMKQNSGCIVNISSLLATHGGQGASAYAASKAGIVAFTRSVAWEVGRFGIRANVLLPGYIDTEMTSGMDSDGKLSGAIPLGRLGEVDEVADAALFLAQNSYAHNCVLNLDGGLSAT
ncbi:NAD(P)-binding protein [Xylariaceae sp. FL1272]|nr:NAD(P)-binding protein [Xylariaceae sp. FL1272]